MGRIEFNVLGPLALTSAEGTLSVSGTRRRAILARLLIEPSHCVPIGRLADDAWDGVPPAGVQSTLRSHLSMLRKALGKDRLFTRNGSVVLEVKSGELDLDAFVSDVSLGRKFRASRQAEAAARHFEHAISLWRGPALSDVDGYSWATPEISRLQESRLEAVESLLETRLQLGDNLQAVAEAELAVNDSPLRERGWAILMVALYRAGRQADALRAYQRVRSHLTGELGIEPSEMLRSLEQAILRQDRLLDHHEATDWGPGAPSSSARIQNDLDASGPTGRGVASPIDESDLSWVARSDSPEMIGRGTEFGSVAAARARARSGRLNLVVISGEPGIGKTRLAAEVAVAAAADGDLVMYGRCNEQPLSPYEALRSALSRIIRHSTGISALAEIGEQRQALAQVIPEARVDNVADGRVRGQAAEAERFQSFEAVSSFLAVLSQRRPAILVLEDLQWSDSPGLAMLGHVLRSNVDAPLLVVVTMRESEGDSTKWLVEDLVDLERTVDVTRIELTGLSPGMCLALYEVSGGEPSGDPEDKARRLREYTGGNPFFLQAVAQEPGTSTPTPISEEEHDDRRPGSVSGRLHRIVRWRLASLSPECKKALSVGAILGLQFRSRILQIVSGMAEEPFLDVLEEALATGVIVEVSEAPDAYRFVHDLVRHSLAAEISSARRIRIHREIAEILEGSYGLNPANSSEIAYHYGAAISPEVADRALLFGKIAGTWAMEHVAYEASAGLFRSALEVCKLYFPQDLEGECELLLLLADALVKSGSLVDADAMFERAFHLARDLGRIDMSASAAIGFGGILPAGAEPSASGLQMLHMTLADLGVGDRRQRALVLGRQAHWSHFCESREIRRAWADESVEIAEGLNDPRTLAASLEYRYWALCGPDDVDRQLDDGRRIRMLGEEARDSETVLKGYKCELHAALEAGDFRGAVQKAELMSELAARVKQPEFQRLGFMWASLVAGIQGDFVEAEKAAADAYSIFRSSGHSQSEAVAVGLSLTWHWLQGRLGEMRPLLEAGRTGRSSLGEKALGVWITAEGGDLAAARVGLDEIPGTEVVAADRNFHWWFLVAGLSHTARILQDGEWADRLYQLVLPFASHNCRVGQATFLGSADYYLGFLARIAGFPERGAAHLDEALSRHRQMSAAPFVELTMHELALTRADLKMTI